ncbi:MAG TPA: HAMP domain-containing protein [Xanthomonadaceae bacterium]|nr:HAMP domain-containing protein [Xanthomonadaceae bacterium]
MLRNSLRVRLLLPVLALVLIVVVVLTLVLATTEAKRVRDAATHDIERQSAALQSLLSVTRSIMIERVQGSMRLLRQEGAALGTPGVGQEVSVGDRRANDLLLGGKPMANNYALVDRLSTTMEGTATIFSRTGQDFVRISTNVKKDDGSRAVGTVLDPSGQVIAKISNNESFYGVVDILGTPYVTGYEPIFAGSEQRAPIGIWYVGYKTDLAALDKVVSESRVLQSGFIALFDSHDELRFHSRTGRTTDQAEIVRIARENPQDWVITREQVPGWGFSLVSAYPKSDVNSVIVRQSLWIAGIGLVVCVLLLGLQSALIWSRVLRPIQHLTAVAEELSLGRWNHTIGEVTLKDEIGTLARAISRLSNSVRLAMERLSKR